MRSRAVLPVVGTVAAVTAVVVAVALVSPHDHAPRPLRLAAGGAASGVARDAAVAPGTSAGTSSSGYVLTGTLPAGRPDDAPAYTLPRGPADTDVVSALATALHAGTPAHSKDGWRAGGLFVSDDAGQSWWWSPCAADAVVTSGERVACAVSAPATSPGTLAPGDAPGAKPGSSPGTAGAGSDGSAPDAGGGASTPGSSGSGSGSTTTVAPPPTPVDASPAPEPDPLPKEQVRAAAKPVFDALGLDLAAAQVESWPYGGSVTLERTVGGLEAYGLQTSVQVGQDGKVQGANGYLGTPDKGDTYPLVTAQDAYADLPPLAQPMLMCPVGPDGQGCKQPEPAEITGAHLGLMVSGLADGGLALVPAWLFDVKGWTQPLPVVAVQKQYLPSPEPVASDDPGVIPPNAGSVEPAPPVADPGAARQAFSFDKVTRGAKPDELVVTYGDSSSCAHRNVTAAAKETSDAIYVALEADARDPAVACTEDYRAVQKTLTLQAPVGDRTVYDASTGKAVPLS